MTDLPTDPLSPEARKGTVDRLCAHFAADHLKTAEFERRLDRAYAAQTGAELVALVQGLPELSPDAETARPLPAPLPAARVDTTRPTRDRDFMLAILGYAKREKNWTPPRRLTSLTIWGATKLDFRDATFATSEIDVMVRTIWGATEIIVPPGVNVESRGIAILGGFGSGPGRRTEPDAPTIRINGFVIWGTVAIKERLPGESGEEASRRLEVQRKAKRRGSVSSGVED